MKRELKSLKPEYVPVVGPLDDLFRSFRRLGGLSRLDVVFSMFSVACVAVWACLRHGKHKAMTASVRPAVCLLTYIPTEKLGETL